MKGRGEAQIKERAELCVLPGLEPATSQDARLKRNSILFDSAGPYVFTAMTYNNSGLQISNLVSVLNISEPEIQSYLGKLCIILVITS